MVVLGTARPSRTRDSTIFALEAETATASTESGIPSPPEAHDPAESISFPARVLSNAPGGRSWTGSKVVRWPHPAGYNPGIEGRDAPNYSGCRDRGRRGDRLRARARALFGA